MKCPICFSRDSSPITTYSSLGYIPQICRICGIIFVEPMNSAGKEFYETSELYSIPDEPRDTLRWHEEEFLDEDIAWENKRILNVGCPTNNFLLRLKNRGCFLTAIDINSQIVKFTRESVKISSVFGAEATDFVSSYQGDKFDIVIFFEVLEHMETPGLFLDNLKNVLKEKGQIFFSVPNRDRPMAHKDMWDYPPHHLTRWDISSITKVMENKCFFINKVTIAPFDAEDALRILGIFFGTLYLKRKIEQGLKNNVIIFIYQFLFKLYVAFYVTLTILLRLLMRRGGVNIYVTAMK